MSVRRSVAAVALLSAACGPLGLGACSDGAGARSGQGAGEEVGTTRERATSEPVWGEFEKFEATGDHDYLGSAVALNEDTAFIGAPGNDSHRGSVYVYRRTESGWSAAEPLRASDGEVGDEFGASVALAGDRAAIAAWLDDAGRGSVYVFAWDGSRWTEEQKLFASERADDDYFGMSVALSGDRLLVGASGPVTASIAGAAYVYVRTGNTWTEEAKLVASNAAAGDNFGRSVALRSDVALVGARAHASYGSAYVFRRNGTSWTETQDLTASDPGRGDEFGRAVALTEDRALIGAPLHESKGAVYAFAWNGSSWVEEQELTAADGEEGALLGSSLSVYDSRVLVGAWKDDSTRGSAYVFSRSGTSFAQEQKLVASDGAPADQFGVEVALSSEWAFLGAALRDDRDGAAYVFHLAGADGEPCTDDVACAHGHCTDGVCCNVACPGSCAACSAAGGAVADGVCAIFDAGSEGIPSCGSGACNGVEPDCTVCASDAQCPPERYCTTDEHCELRKDRGGACDTSTAGDCKEAGCRVCAAELAGCVDGVCCDKSCRSPCQACSARLTGKPNGECHSIPAGEDLEDECEESDHYPDDCGADGTCSGTTSCTTHAPVGLACGATTCTAGVVTGRICDGEGECGAGTAPCGAYQCSGNACRTSCNDDAGCTAGAYCVRGKCVSRNALGRACSADRECEAGPDGEPHCVDGVCCNRACAGLCEECADNDGTCTAVLGAPRNGRGACPSTDETDPCQKRACDGENGESCAGFAGAEVVCGQATCSDGFATPQAACDGAGACARPETADCGAYACAGDLCGDSCAADADCATGFRCDAGACVSDITFCDEDGVTLHDSAGSKSCAPYTCAGSSCRKSCLATAECAAGFVCNPAANECRSPADASLDDGGCSCRLASTSAPSPGSALLVAMLAVLALVRLTRRERNRPAAPRAWIKWDSPKSRSRRPGSLYPGRARGGRAKHRAVPTPLSCAAHHSKRSRQRNLAQGLIPPNVAAPLTG